MTLAVNISNCPCHCPGCHSPYLWDDIGLPLTPGALDDFIAQHGTNITCIAFMGGDADPVGVDMLAQYLHEEYPWLRVAWYSGRQYLPARIQKTDFDYIKLGPYIRHLGPLKKPTTNQRLYRQTDNGQFEDITPRFWP